MLPERSNRAARAPAGVCVVAGRSQGEGRRPYRSDRERRADGVIAGVAKRSSGIAGARDRLGAEAQARFGYYRMTKGVVSPRDRDGCYTPQAVTTVALLLLPETGLAGIKQAPAPASAGIGGVSAALLGAGRHRSKQVCLA